MSAGLKAIQADITTRGGCRTGEAKSTQGCRLPARHVVHAAGPVWQGGSRGEPAALQSCYRRSLQVASAAAARETLPAVLGVCEVIICCRSAQDLAVYDHLLRAHAAAGSET